MYSSHSTAQTIAAAASVKSEAPTVTIKHFAPAGAGLARIVAEVVHTAASRANPKLVMQALRDRFDGRIAAVAGSLQVADKGPVSDTITGIVSAVREAVAIGGDSDMKPFRAIASNMYLDEEDRMWTLNKTPGGSLMVRSNGIDDDTSLLNMLTAVASAPATSLHSQQMMAVASAVRDSVEGGDYITYVNANNEIAHGFLVAIASYEEGSADPVAIVLPHGEGAEAETISLNAITDVQEVDQEQIPEMGEDEQMQIAIAAARDGLNLDHMLDYYRRLFAHAPQYYQQIDQRIRSHAFA